MHKIVRAYCATDIQSSRKLLTIVYDNGCHFVILFQRYEFDKVKLGVAGT